MKKKFLFMSLALSLCFSANATFFNGNHLYAWLIGDNYIMGSAYVAGVSDALEGTNHCLPPGVTIRQLADIVREDLEKSPKLRQYSASSWVATSLKITWPCKPSPTSDK